MSILIVYRRNGGDYLLSAQRMTARQTADCHEPLVDVGMVESEQLGAPLAECVTRQLAQGPLASVSAAVFDAPRRHHDQR